AGAVPAVGVELDLPERDAHGADGDARQPGGVRAGEVRVPRQTVDHGGDGADDAVAEPGVAAEQLRVDVPVRVGEQLSGDPRAGGGERVRGVPVPAGDGGRAGRVAERGAGGRVQRASALVGDRDAGGPADDGG